VPANVFLDLVQGKDIGSKVCYRYVQPFVLKGTDGKATHD